MTCSFVCGFNPFDLDTTCLSDSRNGPKKDSIKITKAIDSRIPVLVRIYQNGQAPKWIFKESREWNSYPTLTPWPVDHCLLQHTNKLGLPKTVDYYQQLHRLGLAARKWTVVASWLYFLNKLINCWFPY